MKIFSPLWFRWYFDFRSFVWLRQFHVESVHGCLWWSDDPCLKRQIKKIRPKIPFFDPLHTVSFDWILSGLEWIINLEFCLLKLLIFYQKLLWNIRSRLNSSIFWVFEPVFKYVWSKSSFFVHKASILIKHI